jgi:hypothetical protein
MQPSRFMWFALAVASALLALGAANASSGSAAKPRLTTAAPAAGKMSVRYTISRFARRGHHLVAYGTAIGRYIPGSAGGEASKVRKQFRAPVKLRARGRGPASAQTICPILTLDLQQLDLNLLGLQVHADRVFLTLKGDSEGGLLGRLLCGLTNSGKLTTQVQRLNFAAKKSGLSMSGTGYTVTLQPPSTTGGSGGGTATRSTVSPLTLCPVLELTLGPLDANLLGLLVHLDQVHLTITADSEGGILGSLFCSVSTGGTPTP